MFVEREFRKCTRLSTVSTVKSEEIAQYNRNIIGRKDGRKEGEIYPAARELIFTRIIMDEEGGGNSPSVKDTCSLEEGNLNSCDVASLYR